LIGDARKARRQMNFEPSVDFKCLVEMMVDADIERLSRPIANAAGAERTWPRATVK